MEINLLNSALALFDANKRLYWPYIFSSLLIAWMYLLMHKKERRINLSKKLWLHKSAILDYKYFVVSFFIKTLLIVPLVMSINEVSLFTYEYLLDSYGFMQVKSLSYTQVMILFTVSLFVVSDFTRYWLHRLLHKVPFLWEFHKVHHSAKVLTPITFYRVHPIENLLYGLRYALSIGFTTGLFIYFFGAMITVFDILGVNILLFLFSLAGSNLRHSHIKITYPQTLEKIFISPYAHQLHHSRKYMHTNFGGYLSIWDGLFKTLQSSRESLSLQEKINFGVSHQEFQSLRALLLTPFKNIFTLKKGIQNAK